MDDVNRSWALGSNQSGTTEGGNTTATEVASIAKATATRMGGEREKVSRFWISIMKDLGSLMQLYMDHEDYVEIVGEAGAKQVEAFTKDDIQGEFLFSVIPDSSLAPDASADRDLALNFHNLVANSPFLDGEQEMRGLVEKYGEDPDSLVKSPEPPAPEKPKVNFAFNGKDLDPAAPQYQNVVNMAIASGIPADQLQAAPQAAPEDIGPAPVVDRERLRMAIADEGDKRSPGGLAVVGR
jgi:hypothetical protein